MNRIKITEDDIFVDAEDNLIDYHVVVTTSQEQWLTEKTAKQLKQQILQDAEKAEKYDKDIQELAKRLEEKKQYCKILERDAQIVERLILEITDQVSEESVLKGVKRNHFRLSDGLLKVLEERNK